MNNAPYQGVANNLAQYGRFGDSQLVHMNPIEVQGLAALSPTGQLTRNPVTGQPEAFLPFLAPLLGSFLGSSLLTGAGAGALGGLIGAAGLSPAAAGAIGSGLATGLATGDLEQGILSGITGFGLGKAFGATGDALSKAGLDTATKTATDALSTGTQAVPDVLSESFQITPEGFVGQGVPTGTIAPDMGITTTPASQLMQTPSALTNLPTIASQVGGMGAAIQPVPPSLTAMQRLSAPLQDPGAFFSELAKPQNILPVYVGEGMGAQVRAEQAMEEGFRRQQEEQDAKRRAGLMRTQSQMVDVFNQLRRDYPGIGYAQGGEVEGYSVGGDIEDQLYRAFLNSPYAGIPSAKETQLSLRGTKSVAPPAASYSALDVGGQGYLPGVAPEFTFFEKLTPSPDEGSDAGIAPGSGNVAGGPFDPDFDFSSWLDSFLARYGDRTGQPSTGGTSPLSDDIQEQLANLFQQQLDPFSTRLGGIESRLGNLNFPDVPDLSGFESRLGGIESRLGNLNFPTFDLSPIEQRLAAIENRPLPNFSLDPVMERLAALESLLSSNPGYSSPNFTSPNFGMQEGGEVPGQMMEQMLSDQMGEVNPMDEATGAYSELIDMTVAAIRGEVENPEPIIQAFVREFGNDAFRQLREAVLQEVVPNAQTEGMIEGMGGGQDDMVPGMIGAQRPVAVSPGEYIIPADVVAMAGGGYSGDGADFFDGLVDDIRMKTMGTTEQVRPYQERSA